MHRVTLPGHSLGKHIAVVDIQTTHPQFLEHCLQTPLLVVCMVADPIVADLMRTRKQRRLLTVYEISDDFQSFPVSLLGHAFYQNPKTQVLIQELAQQADLLQFSSHQLHRKYAHLNVNTVIFMNQLADIPPLNISKAAAKKPPILGWGGSIGHLEDAKQLAKYLKAWVKHRASRQQVTPRFNLMASNELVEFFQQTGLQITHRPMGTFDEYLDFLSSIQIGFALVGSDDFSQGRSDGKFLEYASRGVICIASRQGPYQQSIQHGQQGFLFSTQAEFIETLETVYTDVSLRQQVRHTAHSQISRQRTHEIAATRRLETYVKLAVMPPNALKPLLSAGFQSVIDPTESLMLRATELHAQNQLEEALQHYVWVLEKHPGYYLPWQRGAMIAKALGSEEDAVFFEAQAKKILQRFFKA